MARCLNLRAAGRALRLRWEECSGKSGLRRDAGPESRIPGHGIVSRSKQDRILCLRTLRGC